MMRLRRQAALGGRIAACALPATIVPGMASAHHAMSGALPASGLEGLLSGLAHPVIGLDHLAFLLAAGVLAAGLRRSGALLPPLFVGASLGGTLLFLAGLALGPIEIAVAASVLLAGVMLLVRPARSTSPVRVAALFVVAGLAHGQAFAESILGAEPAPLMAYLLGLCMVQAALAYGAFALTRRIAAGAGTAGRPAAVGRWAGVAASVVGVVFLGLALGGA